MDLISRINKNFQDSISTKQLAADVLAKPVCESAEMVTRCFLNGGKVLSCGNGGSAGDRTNGPHDGAHGVADQVVNSALRYRAQAPLLDSLLQELGVTSESLSGLTGIAHPLPATASKTTENKGKTAPGKSKANNPA